MLFDEVKREPGRESINAPAEPIRTVDARESARTNLFLAAVLHGTQFSAPVKVRNMSATGALVEGGVVPQAGTMANLVRGSLAAPAEVVWSAEGRCGLRFLSFISVRDWLAPPNNQEQQRVDEAVRLLKAGAIPLATIPGGADRPEHGQLGSDLKNIAQLLELVSEHLVSNEATILVHGEQLQHLDIVIQTLNVLGDTLNGDAEASTALSRIENLRVSCSQALETPNRQFALALIHATSV